VNNLEKNDVFIIDIPADIYYVRDTVEKILNFFNDRLSLGKNMIFELKVILNELIVNAIIHGNKGDISKHVFIKAGICKKDKVYIIIEDEGEGMDRYEEICSSTDTNNSNINDVFLLDESGRGLKIVSCLCNSLKTNKKGNKVVVTKDIQ